MAGKQSAFITGANARIKIDGSTLAYCTDVSYNIAVQTIPIETMGTYEVKDNTPVAYTVDGAFSIIRYTSAAIKQKQGTPAIPLGAGSGNSPAAVNINEGTMNDHLNPNAILSSGTFDLEIHERLAGDVEAAATDTTGAIAAIVSEDAAVFVIQDCRLTRRGMTLNKRGVYVDQYAFVGILGGDNEGGTKSVNGSSIQDLS